MDNKINKEMSITDAHLGSARFQDELKYLDEYFFIPVDFELEKKYPKKVTIEFVKPIFEKALIEYCKEKKILLSSLTEQQRKQIIKDKNPLKDMLDNPILVAQMQRDFIGHNILCGFNLDKISKGQNANVFKHISNQQMIDIFVNNKLKKDDLKFEVNAEYKNHIHYSQLFGVAKTFQEIRTATINQVKYNNTFAVELMEIGE